MQRRRVSFRGGGRLGMDCASSGDSVDNALARLAMRNERLRTLVQLFPSLRTFCLIFVSRFCVLDGSYEWCARQRRKSTIDG